MKVAAIVITYNDGYKLENWVKNHKTYCDEIYKHIIVDNGSDKKYIKNVEDNFKGSIIVKRLSNGGCTGAYNDGIKIALSDPEVDSILLIANDIKLNKGSVSILFDYLHSNKELGMVSSVLLRKDQDIVEGFGYNITDNLYMQARCPGMYLHQIQDKEILVESVPGGLNLSKRKFYEDIGFQDDNLFMYSDEVDISFRAKNAGYKIGVTSKAIAWHQHINPSIRSSRLPFTSYLIGRNKVYIASKHFSKTKMLRIIVFNIFSAVRAVIRYPFSYENWQHQFCLILGTYKGFVGDMKMPLSFRKSL